MLSRPLGRWIGIALLGAIGSFAVSAVALAKKPMPDHPVDLNAASAKELEELPGIGPTTANAIIAFRMKSGRIRRVEDLLAIRGVSEAKLKKLRPYVTLGTPATAPPATKKSTTPHVTISGSASNKLTTSGSASSKPSNGSALSKPSTSTPKITVTPKAAAASPQQ